MVADMSDDEIWRLNRGGHDPYKVFAAYAAASKHTGQPTVILAKTVKGYGMGEAGEAQNPTHQQKKMDEDALRKFRDRFNIPVTDEQVPSLPFCPPRRRQPGNEIPARARGGHGRGCRSASRSRSRCRYRDWMHSRRC